MFINFWAHAGNTRVKLFKQYALVSPTLASMSSEALEPFKVISDMRSCSMLHSDVVPHHLLARIAQDLDQDRGCGLGRAQHMVQCLSQAILAEHKDKVNGHQGTVSLIQRQEGSSCWKLDDLGVAEQVYLCTGSHPRDSSVVGYVNPKARNLSLDDVLTPSRLPHIVSDESLLMTSCDLCIDYNC